MSDAQSADESSMVFIANLPIRERKEETRENLYFLFSAYGAIKEVIYRRLPGRQCYAHIVFYTPRSARAAIRDLQGFSFFGQQIRIELCGKSKFSEPQGIESKGEEEQENPLPVKEKMEDEFAAESGGKFVVHVTFPSLLQPTDIFSSLNGYLGILASRQIEPALCEARAEFQTSESAQDALIFLEANEFKASIVL